MDVLLVVSQWIHVTSAALLVGGTFFFRFVLLKYAGRTGGLSEELRSALARRWLHVAWGFILLMVVTGLYQLSRAGYTGSQHMVFGLKMLGFLGVLALLGLLSNVKSEAINRRRPTLLALNVLLGVIIVLCSAWLRRS